MKPALTQPEVQRADRPSTEFSGSVPRHVGLTCDKSIVGIQVGYSMQAIVLVKTVGRANEHLPPCSSSPPSSKLSGLSLLAELLEKDSSQQQESYPVDSSSFHPLMPAPSLQAVPSSQLSFGLNRLTEKPPDDGGCER